MTTKSELSVILYLQTETFVESLTKGELQQMTSVLEFPKDSFIEYLNFNENPSELYPFDNQALRSYLQLKYSVMFPFSLGCFTGKSDLLRKTILWWFTKYTNFDPNNVKLPKESDLNPEQFSLLENVRTKLERRKTLLQICNAGPGTGKTTAANSLAYALREEGVLLISYTNESIKENFKRFFEYPTGRKDAGLKKYSGPMINLVTVDSLAARIIGDSSDKNFDQSVQLASIRIDPMQFLHPTRGKIYNHIVVDECQDIDDLRGNFILTFCQKIGIKSLTLCGDPRQKIRDNCGKWYSELWGNTFDYSKNGHHENNFGPVFRVGFKETYRFQNQQIVNMVNHLSTQRLSLHVELNAFQTNSDYKPVEIISLQRLMSEDSIRDILEPNETACIIGPSIEADNRSANIGRTIASIFRSQGYALSFRSDGAYQPKGIPFLTIHSVKGREFDKVFIFGMNNYPANFSMIPMEEALSLIFVAHSRAKKSVYYIDGADIGNFTLPLHMEHRFIDMRTYEGSVNKPYQDFEKLNSEHMRHFGVSNFVEEHSFSRFLEENRFNLKFAENYYSPDDWECMKKPSQIPANLWGWLLAFDFQRQLTSYESIYDFYFGDIIRDDYIVLSEDTIVKGLLEGSIVNNYRVRDNKRIFSTNVKESDIKLLELHSKANSISYSVILYLYAKYYEEIELDIKALEKIFEGITVLCTSPTLITALEGGNCEVSLTDKDCKVLHGRCDYMDSDMNIYEFKGSTFATKDYKSILQSWLYHVMVGESESFPHILDLSTGHLFEVTSNENIHRWRYILRCYFVLRHHVDLVTSRCNYYMTYGSPSQKKDILSAQNIPDNMYTVDTEFFDNIPFEIAMVNVNDPYRSIVDLIKPFNLEGMIFALNWLPETETEMYDSSIQKLRVKFNMSSAKSKENPILGYYIANTDVDWCSRNDVNKINLGPIARKATEDRGCYLAGNCGPKLGELYTNLAPFPLEYQPHLQAHTALSDSLMLYELLKLGLLKNSL